MSNYADPYATNGRGGGSGGGGGSSSSAGYDYRDRRSPADWRDERNSDSGDEYDDRGGGRSSYRDRSPRDYDRRKRRRNHSRSRSYSRSRSRSWSRSRDRSYSRGRRSSDEDRYSRDRDRYYDDRRDDRRRRSYDDDRSSRGSYESGRSRRDYDYGRGGGSGRGYKDEWLAHVWGDGNRPDSVHTPYHGDAEGGGYEHYDRSSYKSQAPNKTLILRGLGPYVTEKEIREYVIRAGGMPRDIRLIRKKDMGSSRCFAFVEFASTEHARSMVERLDGEFKLGDQRVIMQYSIERDFQKETNSDWYCKCSALNFKRRDHCYRCGSDRKNGECSDSEEGSTHPTHTVMLKGLAPATTEENVLKAIQKISSSPIRSVRVGRDKYTNASRGICYLEMNNVSDAMYLHNKLITERLPIDGRVPYVSYCKSMPQNATVTTGGATASNAGNAAIAAAQWSHQKNDGGSTAAATTVQYTLTDVPRLAEYSAALYAKTTEEKETFVKHYTEYYTKVINEGGAVPSLDEAGSNPSSTGYTEQTQQPAVIESKPTTTAVTAVAAAGELPSGAGDRTYPVPDVSTYQYDKTSGYYYDPFTTLYYDANSQYYFNSKINKFLYWDGGKSTYFLVPENVNAATTEKSGADDDKKSKDKPEDKDKVKVAKRIAKDMERWAKTLNHKKEIAKNNQVATPSPVLKAPGVADIGYTVGVLGKKDCGSPLMHAYLGGAQAAAAGNDSLVAEYGQGSDSEEETEELHKQDDKHVDWVKMACLLCKRAFPNREVLLKHQQMSDLHKQNLEAFYRSTGISKEDAETKSFLYRDRAKERRIKYNEPDVPPVNKLKENYMKARESTANYEQPTRTKIGGDNVGNKLLQKMGWQEGMGLGKMNQGRTDIIQAEPRAMSAGLGTRSQGVMPGPGETYKDCVKKMMRQRYEEVDNR